MYSFENGIEISLSSYLESELNKKKLFLHGVTKFDLPTWLVVSSLWINKTIFFVLLCFVNNVHYKNNELFSRSQAQ